MAQSDLLTAVSYIHEVVNWQETTIHSSLEHSKIVIRHRYNIPLFTILNKRISLHALETLFQEYKRCVDAKGYEICECQLHTSYGLPCSHELLVYMNRGYPVPLEAIDRFWRKLNLSPCASVGDDDLGCQVRVEVENFNKVFRKQSRAGKKCLLRKMKEMTTPLETSLREPTTQKATCGRISFKRAPTEPPSQTQEPAGYNFSSMPSYVGNDELLPPTHEPARYNISSVPNFSSMPNFSSIKRTPRSHLHKRKNHHYVNVILQGDYPMPTIATQWFRYRFECAVAWITPYIERINYYAPLRSNQSNCNVEEVVLE
ncbi:protein FAR-RED IMPAIRED RESPONSE 1 [Artemisia annua]|uniref:Protein FAR-RED IMPAIRED RESPONSE 1 n=1 Tax=Artemisia annua TaxID=35608 RepID=A0A2U1M856_ARTAN|nr:protein FAR-RED IMPAIRED RESPONSE 1 [Artemisia annua]